MKTKKFFLPLILLCISLLAMPVQGAKPNVEVSRETMELHVDPYDLVMNIQTVVVEKSYDENEDTYFVSFSQITQGYLYDADGKPVARTTQRVSYTGTRKGSTLGQFWTGQLVHGWVTNLFEEVPLIDMPDLKGHWVMWFENGDVIREIGSGELPSP